jgi:hypothetical protein
MNRKEKGLTPVAMAVTVPGYLALRKGEVEGNVFGVIDNFGSE